MAKETLLDRVLKAIGSKPEEKKATKEHPAVKAAEIFSTGTKAGFGKGNRK